MATTLPDIAMASATTVDSRGVTFEYDVLNADLHQPVTFGVYRSADARFDPGDISIGSLKVLDASQSQPTLDADGKPDTTLGHHRITLPLANGLPPNPGRPFVLVVADPENAIPETNEANNTASFQTHVIGVITHGGIQPKSWKMGPPWELRMASDLRSECYDAVIPYNWVGASNHPGSAVKQGPRLARMILKAASNFPASDPVDIHFIGHSEGAVINSQAILSLRQNSPLGLQAGYIEDTMLDPHSANNGVAGQQYSVANGILGWIARGTINRFQSRAKDPVVIVPDIVDNAEVFYQHTPVSQAQTNHGLYNLWGQVPVHGPAHYFDLTGPGISHAGRFGVQDWYRLNVVPTLGDGPTFIETKTLTLQQDPASVATSARGAKTPDFQQVGYSGTATPGATVRLFADRVGSTARIRAGMATSGPDGSWHLTTRPLSPGQYRITAMASVPDNAAGRPLHVRPTAWDSLLVSDARGSTL